jgi:phosphoglycerate kinase
MAKKTVKDLGDVRGAHVFVRVDFNVPLEGGRISDDTRIRASLPTLEYLTKGGARLALASHLGRPRKGPTPELSLAPVAARLGELLHRQVPMAPDCVGPDVQRLADALVDGGLLLLENVRFHPEEEKNDPVFARRLVEDTRSTVFVNDAFGSAHRAHASTEGVSHYVRRKVAGFLMEKEIRYLDMAVHPKERPLVAALGGAKVSDKIEVISALLERVDALLIGGGMAYTFFRAKGFPTGKSLVEEDKVPLAADLLKKGDSKITLPVDHVVASRFAWTSVPPPAARTPSGSVARRSWSGTGPWACSR